MLAESLFDLFLRHRDQLANVGGGGLPEVDHDIRVNVGDLRIAVTEAF
jgi:hypothetical protein